jgi:hypothetical protein
MRLHKHSIFGFAFLRIVSTASDAVSAQVLGHLLTWCAVPCRAVLCHAVLGCAPADAIQYVFAKVLRNLIGWTQEWALRVAPETAELTIRAIPGGGSRVLGVDLLQAGKVRDLV